MDKISLLLWPSMEEFRTRWEKKIGGGLSADPPDGGAAEAEKKAWFIY